MNAERGKSDTALRIMAWLTVFIGSSLFDIISREYFGGFHWWVGVAQSAVLTAGGIAALMSERFRGIGRFMLAVAALRLCWYVVAPRLGATQTLLAWRQNTNWGAHLFMFRCLPLVGAGLMVLTLVGAGIRRQDAYLQIGDMAARAEPIPWLGIRRRIRWTVFGPILLVVFGIALPSFLYFSLQPDLGACARVVQFLPWILLTAALNAANEEFQFRCVLLAHLRKIVTPAEAVLITAILFGVGHYYGQPSGAIGVVMASIAGWVWGKSMVETRGFGWAFVIHMVQDIVIFAFLAMTLASKSPLP
ncbi:MAG: CPBP family intramembrane glutamic endopeptidase [Chthoniobacterales bacterium]